MTQVTLVLFQEFQPSEKCCCFVGPQFYLPPNQAHYGLNSIDARLNCCLVLHQRIFWASSWTDSDESSKASMRPWGLLKIHLSLRAHLIPAEVYENSLYNMSSKLIRKHLQKFYLIRWRLTNLDIFQKYCSWKKD